jgi:hypothetical protein
MSSTGAVLLGLLGLAVFWFVVALATHFHPMQIVMGEDGVPSTSKFQFFMWTAVAVFGYIAIFSLKPGAGDYVPLEPLPTNLLIAMGISATTAVGAKAIASQGGPAAPAPTMVATATSPSGDQTIIVAQAEKLGGIMLEDDGSPDLAKIQLVIWTFIAIAIYLFFVFQHVAADNRQLPDIDRTLMILMGLGHSAYLGKKIAVAAGN